MRLKYTLIFLLLYGLSRAQVKEVKSASSPFEVTYTSLKVYPNPVVSQATLEFKLSHDSQVRVSLLNILGAEVKELVRQNMTSGKQNIQFNADQLEKGTYFLRLTVNGDIIKTIRLAVSNRT